MNILVIDDDTAETDLFEILVESFPNVVTRINLHDTWVLQIKKIKPDLIILDLFSPDAENFKICKQIRELVSVPILVVSVINSPDLIAKALDAGADDVLSKPVSKSLLMARLNGLITRNRGSKRRNISLPSH
ncbi:MAG: response regulator [Chloroflexi bacterium]|nr:response regulator [Chloroflexota bacterium]